MDMTDQKYTLPRMPGPILPVDTSYRSSDGRMFFMGTPVFPLAVPNPISIRTMKNNPSRRAERSVMSGLSKVLRKRVRQSLKIRYGIVYAPMIYTEDMKEYEAADKAMQALENQFIDICEYLLLDARIHTFVEVILDGPFVNSGSYLQPCVLNDLHPDMEIRIKYSTIERNIKYRIVFHKDSFKHCKTAEGVRSSLNFHISQNHISQNHTFSRLMHTLISSIVVYPETLTISNKAKFEIVNKMISDKPLHELQRKIKHVESIIFGNENKKPILERIEESVERLSMEKFRESLRVFLKENPTGSEYCKEIQKQLMEIIAKRVHES